MSATIQSAGCPAPAQDNKLLLWQRFIKGRGISYIVLAVIGIVWIFPFLWMALGSLKTQREILAKPPKLMPEHATLANFSQWYPAELWFVLHQQPHRRGHHCSGQHGVLLDGRLRTGQDEVRRQEYLVRRGHGHPHGA